VLITGTLWKHRAEDVDVRHDAIGALFQAGGNAAIEVTGGGVERATERARITGERVAVPRRNFGTHVENIDAGSRDELERQL
jgi:hypothetical protein